VGLAGEGDQALETAVGTAYPCKAPGEDAAVQVGAKLPFDEGGEAVTVGAPFPGRGEERLQPLPDDLVQEGLLGFAPVVGAAPAQTPSTMGFPSVAPATSRRTLRGAPLRSLPRLMSTMPSGMRSPTSARIPMASGPAARSPSSVSRSGTPRNPRLPVVAACACAPTTRSPGRPRAAVRAPVARKTARPAPSRAAKNRESKASASACRASRLVTSAGSARSKA
jgi:hypothetical protein